MSCGSVSPHFVCVYRAILVTLVVLWVSLKAGVGGGWSDRLKQRGGMLAVTEKMRI